MKDELEFHPIANIFPMIEGEEWEKFKEDIKEQGVLVPITLYQGKILDGRNRYKAAEELDVPYRTEIYSGNKPAHFVASRNLRLRYMTVAQRAQCAAELANIINGHNRFRDKVGVSIDTPTNVEPVTTDEAAEMFGVGRASVARAKKIEREATPEVIKEVKEGRMTQNAAMQTLKNQEDLMGNVVQLGVERKDPLTKKQMDIHKTKEYRELKAKYDAALETIEELKRKIAMLTRSTGNANS